ncbi:NUDIX domain-containing protein, partial [Polaribacter sp.]|nr:NUDIX domain-containing protein [Polaribacter sp.]
EHNRTRILLSKRASYKGTHSAQISFPGGKTALNDRNLEQTARRETFEEVMGLATQAANEPLIANTIKIAITDQLLSIFQRFLSFSMLRN